VSDVFGALTEQHALGQTADQASWLIGAGIFTDAVEGEALRSIKAPGTAYDDDVLGKDPQPAHMRDYVETTDDNGGVHINSGIPNHAFYLLATSLGGEAWTRAGLIWYRTLTGGSLANDADFPQFAQATLDAAAAEYGEESEEAAAVRAAWIGVGVLEDDSTDG
jgi:Zn-dependent metalloprotease